jgi:2,4-didehydro-3-deoxy-L-rhamnonate hydrolase
MQRPAKPSTPVRFRPPPPQSSFFHADVAGKRFRCYTMAMRICRYGDNRLGIVEGDLVYDVSPVLLQLASQTYPLPQYDILIEALPRLRASLETELASAKKTGRATPLVLVHLLSPIANPSKIIGAPINYKAHVEESKADQGIAHGRNITTIADWGLFLKANTSLIGVSSDIKLRFTDEPQKRRNDHEIELGVVIGKQCTNVSRDNAFDYIAGYTACLDMTLRGTEFQCFRKSIDTYSVAGPCFVTKDEIADPNHLDLWLTVNGQDRQKSNTQHLVFNIERLIEFASSFYTLYPGDIIMTGTPAGVGPVSPGDVIHAGVEGVGEFSIRISA